MNFANDFGIRARILVFMVCLVALAAGPLRAQDEEPASGGGGGEDPEVTAAAAGAEVSANEGESEGENSADESGESAATASEFVENEKDHFTIGNIQRLKG